MLKSLNMICAYYDQLFNVIFKIQNYYDDLFYRCNLKKQNKRTRNRRNKNKRKQKTKYVKSVANVCHCKKYLNKRTVKISYQISDSMRHVCFYFHKKFNNIQLVIVIFLLALITTTAHSTADTQGMPVQKSATTLLTVSTDAVLIPANLTKLIPMPCFNIPKVLSNRTDSISNIKQNICYNLKYKTYRHLNGQRHLQLHTRKILQNPLSHKRKKNNNLKLSYNNTKNSNNIIMKHQIRNPHYNYRDNLYNKTNVQNYINILSNSKNYNFNTKVIEFKEKNMTKDLNKIDKLNINKLLQHIHTNNSYNNNNIISGTYQVNDLSNQEDINEERDDDDDAEINNSKKSVNLRPPPVKATNRQQYIDYTTKLMKLVMDGLGLKNPPNMKTVNISQTEYAAKYREYLQRVHTRKSRELRALSGDDNIVMPLQIFSIISNNTLLSQDGVGLVRVKRDMKMAFKSEHSNEKDAVVQENNKNQSLEEDVKNILFLRRKYQKPRSTKKERDERKTKIRLMFALKPEILNLSSSDIEEANIRLVLIHSPHLAIKNYKYKKSHAKSKNNTCGFSNTEGQKNNHQTNIINLKLYSIAKTGKRQRLDGRNVDIHINLEKPDETHTQWLQFDVTKAVKITIDDKHLQHVVLELQCDNCKRIGARILNDAYNTAADAQADDPSTEGYHLMPVLNIIGRFEQIQRSMRPHKYDDQNTNAHKETTAQRQYHHQIYNNNNNNNNNRHSRRTNCYKANQRCCRHTMEVTFKEIKGFEFIIQPKVFDAGYCHGRCPPRFNPAHHHAMLQSLIWKQSHHKAPRPCCAPSKLVELEVLHVDEKDSEKLKISTWKDMKVVECACS